MPQRSPSSTESRRRQIAIAAGVITAVAAVLLVWHQVKLVGDFRVDDAYITFSFAKNLGQGDGPVYSHGVRVEGYSNFLWMVILGIGYAVRANYSAYATARVISFVLFAAAGWATWKIVRRQGGVVASSVAVLLLALATDITRAAMSGLETVAVMALVALGVHRFLAEPKERRRYSLLWFLAAALTRIDAVLVLLYVVVFELAAAAWDRRLRFRTFALWIGPALALYGAYYAWRWAYYGHLFPMTYYAKQLVDSQEPLRAFDYAWDALRASGLILALPVMLLGIVRRASRDALFVAGIVGLHIAYVVWVTGGDWMPFERFWVPVVPLLMVLFAWGAAETWRWASAGRWFGRLGAVIALTAIVRFVAVRLDESTIETAQERYKQIRAAEVMYHTRNNLLAAVPYLRMVIRHPGEKLVTDYGGVFGLYIDAQVIEMWGLCNEAIALRGTVEGINAEYGKTCLSCYEEMEPDYFHVTVPFLRDPGAFRHASQVVRNIFQGPQLDAHLHLTRNYAVGRVINTQENRALFFLERRRSGVSFEQRQPEPGFVVDYPFEPSPTARLTTP